MVPLPLHRVFGGPPQLTSELRSVTQPGGRHCECGQRQLGSHGLEDPVPSPGVAADGWELWGGFCEKAV